MDKTHKDNLLTYNPDGSIRYIHRHRYNEPGIQEACHRLKAGNLKAIRQAAKELAPLFGSRCTVVPVPSHTGRASSALLLATAISHLNGCKVEDIIQGEPRTSLYELKKAGESLPSPDKYFGFRLTKRLPENEDIIILDTVTATRTTAEACLKLLPKATVVTYADDEHARFPYSGYNASKTIPEIVQLTVKDDKTVKNLSYEEKIESILSMLATPIYRRKIGNDELNKLITDAYIEMKEKKNENL